MVSLTEQYIFTRPFLKDDPTNHSSEPIKAILHLVHDDRELQSIVGKFKQLFLEKQESLVHGDLHSGSILVRPTDGGVKVIDAEFAYIGPSALDLGLLLASYVFSYSAHKEKGNDGGDMTFCELLCQAIHLTGICACLVLYVTLCYLIAHPWLDISQTTYTTRLAASLAVCLSTAAILVSLIVTSALLDQLLISFGLDPDQTNFALIVQCITSNSAALMTHLGLLSSMYSLAWVSGEAGVQLWLQRIALVLIGGPACLLEAVLLFWTIKKLTRMIISVVSQYVQKVIEIMNAIRLSLPAMFFLSCLATSGAVYGVLFTEEKAQDDVIFAALVVLTAMAIAVNVGLGLWLVYDILPLDNQEQIQQGGGDFMAALLMEMPFLPQQHKES
uniref:Aminoglycoside phosphotransferase domain-containing protein n=1 Tax=Branchiostoma floridae TaxID=7739 RepID=C3ZWB7_BRAFL|eukprot:XP_002587108.1 hypothetical protein BRAFLDRAFT_102200 [Branchiostoma floridae]